MVVGKSTTNLCADHQKRQKNSAEDQVGVGGDLANIDHAFLVLSEIPSVDVGHKDQVIDKGMGDGGLDSGYHGRFGFAISILFPWAAVFLDHAHELDVARHDGRDRCDETRAEEEVAETGDVEESGGRIESGGEELRLDPGCGQGIQDVQTPGQSVEGNGKVHDGRVNRMTGGHVC